MLKVKVNYQSFSIKMTGHAGYAELDKDIVCAGASMLFYALAATVKNFQDSLAEEPILNIEQSEEKGAEYEIKVTPKPEFHGYFSVMYEQTLNGLRLLSESYPDNITIEEPKSPNKPQNK